MIIEATTNHLQQPVSDFFIGFVLMMVGAYRNGFKF